MSRKNSPGCYCCDTDPPPECIVDDCCDPEQVFPTINAGTGEASQWSKRYQITSTDCCCTTAMFDWIGPSPLTECCEPLGFYQYRHEARRKDYGWKIPSGIIARQTGCGSTNCGDAECCLGLPEVIAEWLFYWQDRFSYYFVAQDYIGSLEVTYGRQLIECDGDETPQCRYYIQTILRGVIQASITTERTNSTGQLIDYLHPCYDYVGPDCDPICGTVSGWSENIKFASGDCDPKVPFTSTADSQCQFESECKTCPYPQTCDVPFANGSECQSSSVQSDTTPSGCWNQTFPYCVKRIKFFDTEPPLGSYNFSSTDPAPPPGCDLPNCGSECTDSVYTDEPIVMQSGDAPTPPWWYTDPPTIQTTTTTYVLDGSLCSSSYSSAFDFQATGTTSCCGEGLTLIQDCDYAPCESPVTVTQICKSINDDPRLDWTGDNALQCRLETWYLNGNVATGRNDITGGCGNYPGCGGAGAGVGDQYNVPCCAPVSQALTSCYFSPCVKPACNSGQPCGDVSCCFEYTCDCFCECIPLYPYLGHYADLYSYEITNSGSWTPAECIFQISDIVINLT